MTAACGATRSDHLDRAIGTTTSSAPVTTTTVETTTTTAAPAATTPTARATPRTAPRARSTAPGPGSTGAPGGSGGGGGPNLAAVNVHLVQIATLQQPLAMALRNGDPDFYFAQKTGQVVALRGNTSALVLDLGGQVAQGSEQGLLGLAFSADGGHLYVNYTDTAGDTHIVEYAMAGGSANLASRRELFSVPQPAVNHNGGNLVFGSDGMLWVGLGDGGGSGDPNNNAQNQNTPLGKMLRMDAATGAYHVWAMGLRNPWRYSFDRANGDLWIGDVGQNAWEEVDHAPGGQGPGANYGWSRFEGTHVYNASRAAPGAIPPVIEYSHDGGNCSVTGGYVYRGSRIPALAGGYLYGDFCVGHVFGFAGGQSRDLGMVVSRLSSFGEDRSGELYALSLGGPVYRIDPA
jgi:glucose/arabinose dehydrogenase